MIYNLTLPLAQYLAPQLEDHIKSLVSKTASIWAKHFTSYGKSLSMGAKYAGLQRKSMSSYHQR